MRWSIHSKSEEGSKQSGVCTQLAFCGSDGDGARRGRAKQKLRLDAAGIRQRNGCNAPSARSYRMVTNDLLPTPVPKL